MAPPTILILAGLNGDRTRLLLPFLLPASGPAKATFIRVVDKALVIPQAGAYTTYVDQTAREAFKRGTEEGKLEYLQGNLLSEATRIKAFTLPEKYGGPSKGFDIVFDCSGESDFDLPIDVHIERTLRLALSLGEAAANPSAPVGCYVRLLTEFYHLEGDKKGKIGEDGPGKPWGERARWFHEAGRGLAGIKGLNLVLARPALMSGGFTVTGLTPRALIGEVYKYLNEKLEFLWASGLAQNTVHAEDFASALFAIAEWALKNGREKVLELAGEELPTALDDDTPIKTVPGAARKADKVKAAVFNIVDDGETSQTDFATVISEVVGVESGFHGSIISQFAKMNLAEVIDEVNEKHLEGWSELLTHSNPPISSNIAISPTIPADLLQPHPISFSSKKLKELTGWKPAYPKMTADVLRASIEGFRAEGNWPNAKKA